MQSVRADAVGFTHSQAARTWCGYDHLHVSIEATEFFNGLFGQLTG
jgi:hypothetical protein